jgi:hypothetical protein
MKARALIQPWFGIAAQLTARGREVVDSGEQTRMSRVRRRPAVDHMMVVCALVCFGVFSKEGIRDGCTYQRYIGQTTVIDRL